MSRRSPTSRAPYPDGCTRSPIGSSATTMAPTRRPNRRSWPCGATCRASATRLGSKPGRTGSWSTPATRRPGAGATTWVPSPWTPTRRSPTTRFPSADRDELDRAFRRVPADQRAVLVLQHYLDMALPEIAETLNVPLGTVKMLAATPAGRRFGPRSKPMPDPREEHSRHEHIPSRVHRRRR